MEHDEWYKPNVVSKHEEQKAETFQKMIRNKASDIKQYEKYKEILGKDAPKSFTDFRDLKYNNIKDWENLKHRFVLFNKEAGLQNRLDYIIDNEKGFIPTNSKITNCNIIAGNGCDVELRSRQMLSDSFGGYVDKWSKKVGNIESDKYIFDIHWNEYKGKQYIVKIKNRKKKKI